MKKINTRIKSAIMQGFIFNVILTVTLLWFFLYSTLPNLFVVREKQSTLQEAVSYYKNMQSQWLTLKELKAEYWKSSLKDPYVTNLLKTIDENFYEENLVNTTDGDYKTFLLSKKQSILEEKDSDEYRSRDAKISTILPSYSDSQNIEWSLTDYQFISYIEALLFTFNLETQDSIGTGNIESIKSVDTKNIENSLNTSIFYIPLELSVVGQKKDILDFLHYLENVGSINIENGEIQIYTDNVITKPLEWEQVSSEYNIYENQIADIQYIVMKDYIDASPQPNNADLSTFIKQTQGRERFTAQIKMQFYISWLPDYKVEKFITDTSEKYEQIQKLVTQEIAKIKKATTKVDSGDVLFAISTINSLGGILNSMETSSKDLRKTFLQDPSKIESVYLKTQELDSKLDQIQDVFTKNKVILDTINK